MKKSKNEPIVLTANVFLSKLLALEMSGRELPPVERLRAGDVKLLAVGKGVNGYAGFIVAYVWSTTDKRWRKLGLRAGAAVEAIYHGPEERRLRARAAIDVVGKLRGTTVTFKDGRYLAPKSQSGTKSASVTTHGGGVYSRSTVAAAPASPTGATASSPMSPDYSKPAVEPVGRKSEQLRLFD